MPIKASNDISFFLCRFKFRVLDAYGTEAEFNVLSYASNHGYRIRQAYGLHLQQFLTMYRKLDNNEKFPFIDKLKLTWRLRIVINDTIEFLTISRSRRSNGEIPLSVFVGIEYLLIYVNFTKGQSPEITITCKI